MDRRDEREDGQRGEDARKRDLSKHVRRGGSAPTEHVERAVVEPNETRGG